MKTFRRRGSINPQILNSTPDGAQRWASPPGRFTPRERALDRRPRSRPAPSASFPLFQYHAIIRLYV